MLAKYESEPYLQTYFNMNLTEFKRRVMEWLWAKTTLDSWDVDVHFVTLAHAEGQSPEECANHILDMEYRKVTYAKAQ